MIQIIRKQMWMRLIMKSDGKHVFTAYGDILVLEVWDVKSGLEVSLTLTKMPRRNVLS